MSPAPAVCALLSALRNFAWRIIALGVCLLEAPTLSEELLGHVTGFNVEVAQETPVPVDVALGRVTDEADVLAVEQRDECGARFLCPAFVCGAASTDLGGIDSEDADAVGGAITCCVNNSVAVSG